MEICSIEDAGVGEVVLKRERGGSKWHLREVGKEKDDDDDYNENIASIGHGCSTREQRANDAAFLCAAN
jgi:hypothetical protein